MLKMTQRPRRLRRTAHIRDMVHEVDLRLGNLVQPYFLAHSDEGREPIAGFTDVYRLGLDPLSRAVESDIERGLKQFLLFGYAADETKDRTGSHSHSAESDVAKAVHTLKSRFGDNAVLFTDVCLCPYTDHGHCGVLNEEESVDNDESLEILVKMALTHAEAGADFVAPSDMMDGRVGAIRAVLDEEGHSDVGILSYTAKYASCYYGPFRSALGSAPKGDRSSYQMDYRNVQEAMRELKLDIAEGADIVMVKPALAYLDVIARFHNATSVPIAAYSVSGEYEMVKQLAKCGMADEKKMVLENLTAIRRAGAQLVVSYHASQAAEKGWIK
jgi:porphobilinogen synthase